MGLNVAAVRTGRFDLAGTFWHFDEFSAFAAAVNAMGLAVLPFQFHILHILVEPAVLCASLRFISGEIAEQISEA